MLVAMNQVPLETLKLRHGEVREVEGGIGMLIDEDDVEILARLSFEFQYLRYLRVPT